jgi:glutathione S-transferase
VLNRKVIKMSDQSMPTLYTFRRCPYAMRARMAIAASGIECEVREILLRDKPEEFLAASPKGTVPVVILRDGEVLEQSLDVMLWALGENDPLDWLPVDNNLRSSMLSLIDEADGDFKHHLDHYKYANRYGADPEDHKDQALVFLRKLEALLSTNPFLFGAKACLADHAIFPFVRQFANTDREWFDGLPLPKLHVWLSDFLNGDVFNSVMPKLKPWTNDDPVLKFSEVYV